MLLEGGVNSNLINVIKFTVFWQASLKLYFSVFEGSLIKIIFFFRDPLTFNSILNFYRTDHLHVIDELCVLDFAEDLEFWMIKEINLEICCVDKFNTRRDHILAEVNQ